MSVFGSMSRVFGLQVLKKYWELWPITVLLGGAVAGATGFVGFSLYHKPDVWILGKSEGIPPWEKRSQTQPINIKEYIIDNQRLASLPEIEALRREVGSYKAQ